MKSTLTVALVLSMLAGCDQGQVSELTFDPPTIEFSDRLVNGVDTQTIPVNADDKFPIKAKVSVKIPGLRKGVRASVWLDGPAEAGAVGRSATQMLTPDGDSFSYEFVLNVPQYREQVSVYAEVAGVENHESIAMDKPQVAWAAEPSGWTSSGWTQWVCIESSATGGTVLLESTSPVFAGSTNSSIKLSAGAGCKSSDLTSPRRSNGRFLATCGGGTCDIRARLQGTDAEKTFTLQGEKLTLDVLPLPATLPQPGQILTVTVSAKLPSGLPAAGVPVRLETLPKSEVFPEVRQTDSQGQAVLLVLVPDDAVELAIAASAPTYRRDLPILKR